jgi:phage gp29-like protein
MPLRRPKSASARKLAAPIVRPSSRDFEPHLFGRGMSPDTLGQLLSAGARGALNDQNDLFNLMEDTWPRLRANLQKVKNAIRKLPLNVQPFTPKNGKPSTAAQEKADFIQTALRVHSGYADTARRPLGTAVYELMDAIARGISVVEIDWHTDPDGYLVPLDFRRVPTRYLGIDPGATLALNLPPAATSPFRPHSLIPHSLTPFSAHPHKFIIGIFRSKSGALGEAAQLRCLAPLWLGNMLGWEWLVQKAELFGTPLRWANYPATATQSEIDAITAALRNMGAAAWGAFPQGTNLQILQGSVPGVSGSNDPSERLLSLADRACDILFLGQNLTSEMNGEGSRAAAQVHREVELDLYETYAEFIVSILNEQLIPALIELNWGNLEEMPFVDVEINRPARDEEMARRDKLLFQEMGLPVSLQYLYERHRIPAPDPGDALFQPPTAITDNRPPTTASPSCSCGCASISGQCGSAVSARSETALELAARQHAAIEAFPAQLAAAEAAGDYLVWDSVLDDNTTQICRDRHGRRWGDGWFAPPPAHYNCRSTLIRAPKSTYAPPQ